MNFPHRSQIKCSIPISNYSRQSKVFLQFLDYNKWFHGILILFTLQSARVYSYFLLNANKSILQNTFLCTRVEKRIIRRLREICSVSIHPGNHRFQSWLNQKLRTKSIKLENNIKNACFQVHLWKVNIISSAKSNATISTIPHSWLADVKFL